MRKNKLIVISLISTIVAQVPVSIVPTFIKTGVPQFVVPTIGWNIEMVLV